MQNNTKATETDTSSETTTNPLEWEERRAHDVERHKAGCEVCRYDMDPGDNDLYAIKNKTTRQFVHIIAEDSDEAIAKTKWPTEDIGYLVLVTTGTGKKMSVETKALLKERNKQKRQAKKVSNARIKTEVIDKVTQTCYSGPEGQNQPRKEVENMSLNEWVKQFMEGFIFKDDNGKRTMDPRALFGLAEVNKLDIKKYKSGFKASDAGRIRMTIGNMLRGAAARRHKLLTPGGKSTLVPPKLVKGQPTEDAKGERIRKSA